MGGLTGKRMRTGLERSHHSPVVSSTSCSSRLDCDVICVVVEIGWGDGKRVKRGGAGRTCEESRRPDWEIDLSALRSEGATMRSDDEEGGRAGGTLC